MKYVALSDVHLGQNGADGSGFFSVLSDLPENMLEKSFADGKLRALADRIAQFADGDQVTLVLCGDTLDLALCHMRQALSDLVRLIKSIPQVEEVILVVGNHDHHIWSMHSERRRYIDPMRRGQLPAPGAVYKITNPQGEDAGPLGYMLSAQVGRKKALKVRVAYPYFMTLVGDDTTVHFSHGHLMGGLYTLTSRILRSRLKDAPPERAAATVNVAIIEAIYWLFGEMGERMGANGMMEALYSDIKKGKDSIFKELIHGTVDVVLKDGVVSCIPDSWERALVRWVGSKIAEDIAKKSKIMPASADRHEDPRPSRDKFIQWLIDTERMKPTHGRSVFVFGHTHSADHFQVNQVPLEGMPKPPLIEAFNMGGWLVEPERPDPDTYVFMIDSADGNPNITWEKV